MLVITRGYNSGPLTLERPKYASTDLWGPAEIQNWEVPEWRNPVADAQKTILPFHETCRTYSEYSTNPLYEILPEQYS